jgi:hypothetical protein
MNDEGDERNGSVRLVLGRGVSVPWQLLSTGLVLLLGVVFVVGFSAGRCATPGGVIVN